MEGFSFLSQLIAYHSAWERGEARSCHLKSEYTQERRTLMNRGDSRKSHFSLRRVKRKGSSMVRFGISVS